MAANKIYTDNFSEFLSDYSDNSAWMKMKFDDIAVALKSIKARHAEVDIDESLEICAKSGTSPILKSKLLIESLKPLFMGANEKLDQEGMKQLNLILTYFIDIAKRTLNSDIARGTLDVAEKI